MRKVWALVGSMTFVSVIAFAQAPRPTSLSDEDPAFILTPVVATSSASCSNPQRAPAFAAKKPEGDPSKAIVYVSCGSLGSIQCTITSTSTWTAYERNCPLERGRLICDGVTYSCPRCQLDSCNNCNQNGNCQACCLCYGAFSSQCQQCGPNN